MRTYLKAHAYGNTVTTDLSDTLEDASGAPVRDVMNTFILQGGHPLVTLENGELHQQPFAYGPVPPGTVSAIGSLVRPGRVAGPARRSPAGSAPSSSRAARRAGAGPGDRAGTVVVNAGGWGVFRVGYETEHRLALAEHLAELTPLGRANLLGDTWATTLAGHTRLEEFLRVAARLGWRPTPRRGRPSARPSCCATGSPVPTTVPACTKA